MASVASAGRVFVTPKEGWREPTNLYTVCALEPGSMKSPVFEAFRRPVDAFEARLQEDAAQRLAAEREALERSIARHKKIAGDTDDAEVREREIAIAAAEAAQLEALPLPVRPRLTTADATPEGIQRLLSLHGGVFAVLHDEGGVFDIMAGRFSPNTNLDPWLAGHNGGRLASDRKGAKGEGEVTIVEHAYLTMGFAVQPSVLEELGRNGRLEGRGITARFLYGLPSSRIGSRDLVASTPVPARVRARYEACLTELLERLRADTDGPWPAPIELTLSEGAARRFQEFQHRCERALDPGGPLQWLRGWGSKLPGQTVRIAALLHMLEHYDGSWGSKVSEGPMEAAVRIAVCLVDHARAVHDVLGMADDLADARVVLDWLIEKRVERFTLRTVYKAVRKLDSRRARAAMQRLVEYGWVREVVRPYDERNPGRQPEEYVSHPSIYESAAGGGADAFAGLGG